MMNFTERECKFLRTVLEMKNFQTQQTIKMIKLNPGQYVDDPAELEERIDFVNGIIQKITSKDSCETGRYCSISTAHITRETDALLKAKEGVKNDLPIYFPKRIEGTLYGYIFVVAGWDEYDERHSCCPDDLKACLQYAQSLDCAMLVLDGDCEIVDGLPVYEW